ncbi:tRNA (pseudouridine(54)-N(1))-methyltransferase TrmY [Halorutilales archaeon Cl-col2-1]
MIHDTKPRQFVVVGHDAPTEPDFSLDSLTQGRLDLLCRCVTSSFVLSHSLRDDTRLYLVLSDEVTLRFEGDELRHLNPDERSTASLVRKALKKKDDVVGMVEAESTPGIYVSQKGFEDVLSGIGTDSDTSVDVVELHEDGEPVTQIETDVEEGRERNLCFVLSDHHDLTDGESRLVEEVRDRRVSLGSKSLHADDSITVMHNYLDTRGYEKYKL